MIRKTLVLAGLVGLAGAPALDAATASLNSVGYADITLAETSPFTVCMLANPFINGDNKLDTILPEGPELTEVYTWDGAAYEQYIFSGGGWILPSGIPEFPTLGPGSAFWYHPANPLPVNPFRVTFVGEVPQGVRSTSVGAGFRMVSPPGGWAGYSGGLLSGTGFPGADFDQFYVFHCDTLSWDIYNYFEGWLTDPPLRMAEGLWSEKLVAGGTWSQTVNVNDGGDSLDPLLVLSGFSRSGGSFTFEFSSQSGQNYQVQSKSSPETSWVNVGGAIAGTGSAISFTDSSATSASKVYRITR